MSVDSPARALSCDEQFFMAMPKRFLFMSRFSVLTGICGGQRATGDATLSGQKSCRKVLGMCTTCRYR